jgi:hypothetical protein
MTYVDLRTLANKDLSHAPFYYMGDDLSEYLVSVKQDEQDDKFVVEYFDGRDRVRTLKPVDGDVSVFVNDSDILQTELAALRRQVAVLEHDRSELLEALARAIGADEANRVMNVIRASTPPAEDSDATE